MKRPVGHRPTLRAGLLTALTCAALFGAVPAGAQNMLSNGDFEHGNRGFTSDYTYDQGNVFPESTYAVLRSPRDGNPYGADFPDHTTGKGLMLVVNGSPDARNAFWRKTQQVADHQAYVFSGWVCSWGMDAALAHTTTKGIDPNPSVIHVTINGVDCGEEIRVPAANGEWLHFQIPWNSGDVINAKIEMRLLTTARDGNDLAVDDLAFGPSTPDFVPPDRDGAAGGAESTGPSTANGTPAARIEPAATTVHAGSAPGAKDVTAPGN
jgi:hypothetical protein